MTKEQAKQIIKELVTKFDANIESYKQADYKEARVRVDYLDPFFQALGWDIRNQKGLPEQYREVIYEDKIKMSGLTKEPDYGFTVNGVHKFFVEAKKPSILIKESQSAAFQVRKYGWNKKLAVSILSDFEELAVYNCTVPIDEDNDNASTMRIKYIHYKDYEKNFDYIWELFGRDNVFKGIFDEFVKNKVKVKGSEDVDVSFLKSLDKWRDELAQGIISANRKMSEDDLNLSVQKILDRIVFLRIAEDRLIEPIERLKKSIKAKDVYLDLFEYFEEADKKYNSGLFDLSKDKVTKNIKVYNKTIISIISKLYKMPYDFAIMPIEILGYAYEQFLGKKIYLDKYNKLEITEKPEVKKAGGVYYTPQYIVEYIVKNTIGKLIANKTPEQIAEIKICDPSCGSGSFLIGAYTYLLDYHLKYYLSQKKRDNKILTPDNHLTSSVKKQILLNNIFGVDIDKNAIEVTKLSLLLKALENETIASINQAINIFHERVLPTLDENIKSGNSLIDMDFYDNEIDFDNNLVEKEIKPFNWKQKFPQVFDKNKGFDFIIGNPPYVNVENLQKDVKEYYFKNFASCVGRTDVYIAFIENSLNKLLLKNGELAFIIPYAFTNQNYGEILRKMLIQQYYIKEIVDISEYYVFRNANVKNIILILKKQENQKETKISIAKNIESFSDDNFKTSMIDQQKFLELKSYRFETKPVFDILNIKNKIWENANPLEKICLVAYGARLNHKEEQIGKKNYIFQEQKKGFKPFLEGKNIERYHFSQNGWLDYQPAQHYNSMFKELFENEKIMFINVVKDKLRFAFDKDNFYNSHTVINCVRIDLLQKATHVSAKSAVKNADLDFCKQYDYRFLLAILNSSLINWYFVNFLSEKLHFYPNDAKSLPIINIDIQNKSQKKMIDDIIKNVDFILKLYEQLKKLVLPSQIDTAKGRILFLEEQIDNFIFDLYNLSEEERELIIG